jgi:CheY-like chemotaxis protein
MENKEILLVEDNIKDIELTKRALQKSNVTNKMVVAEDGVEALKYLFGEDNNSGCDFKNLPVVILLDLKLPKVDGLEVLRRIRECDKTKLIPVVVLTSSDEEKDIMASYNLGANSFIRKPVIFNDFVEAIRHLGLYWLILNKPAPNGGKK